MSQHTYTAVWHGEILEVICGWDRPLNAFFLTILGKGPAHPDDCPCDLEVEDKVMYDSGLGSANPKDLNEIMRVLDGFGVPVPERIRYRLLDDKRNSSSELTSYGFMGEKK